MISYCKYFTPCVAKFRVFVFLLVACVVQDATANYVVENLEPENRAPLDRAYYAYEFQVRAANAGTTGHSVTAHASSGSPDTLVIDGSVYFGDFPANSTQIGGNPLLIHQKRRTRFDPSVLQWRFTESVPGGNQPPVADAGADRIVHAPGVVTLDGSGSFDPESQALSYHWRFVTKPLFSKAELSDANTVSPRFTVDEKGRYEIQLIVNDGQTDSSLDVVAVTYRPTDLTPVIQLQRDGNTLTLDGGGSASQAGGVLHYEWRILKAPPFSNANFSDRTAPRTTFRITDSGDYEIALVVSDSTGESATDVIKVSSTNTSPVAVAQASDERATGVPILLDGRNSGDGDDDPLDFHWSLLTKPSGSQAVLATPGRPQVLLVPDVAGDYRVQLVVSDGFSESNPDVIELSVVDDTSVNHPPEVLSTPPSQVAMLDQFQYQVVASDIDNDTLSFQLLSGPPGMHIDAANGLLEWVVNAGGVHAILIQIRDARGESHFHGFQLTVNAPTESLPLDPAAIAPPLDDTAVTPFEDSVAFLYTGPHATQSIGDPGVLDSDQVAVIRGKVLDAGGRPLPGVVITLRGFPEYGFTTSRGDGWFDLAINGGSSIVVEYSKAGFLAAQRRLTPDEHDFSVLDDVVLVPRSPRIYPVDLTEPVSHWVSGEPVGDSDGTRRTSVFFPSDTVATLPTTSGGTALDALSLRITEYTAGEGDLLSIPGSSELEAPLAWVANFHIDEANSNRVDFSQPVPIYIDNYLNLDTGTRLPIQRYDTENANWTAEPDGRVVEIAGIVNDKAVLKLDGTGQPANEADLTALGITEEELRQLAQRYPVGASLWRFLADHFSIYGVIYPANVLLPPAGGPAGGNDRPPATPPRVVEIDPADRVELDFPLIGSSHNLHYSSVNAMGNRAARSVEITLSEASLPPLLARIRVSVQIAGQLFNQSFPAEPNQTFTYTWDGKDAYGRVVNGPRTASIQVTYSFKNPPGVLHKVLRQSFRKSQLVLGRRRNTSAGLGGLTLDILHAYDPTTSRVQLGGGEAYIPGSGGGHGIKSCSVVAGDGSAASPVEGEVATQGGLAGIAHIAVSRDGAVYLGGAHRIWVIAPDGTFHAVAGTGQALEGSPQPSLDASTAMLGYISDITAGPNNHLFVAESLVPSPDGGLTGYIRRIDIPHESIDLVEEYASPGSLAVNDAGNLYFSGSDGLTNTGNLLDYVTGNVDELGYFPDHLAVAPDESIVFGEFSDVGPVKRIETNGNISQIPWVQLAGYIGSLSVGPDSTIYIVDLNDGLPQWYGLKYFTADGDSGPLTLTLADAGSCPPIPPGNDLELIGSASNLALYQIHYGNPGALNAPEDIAAAPDGGLYVLMDGKLVYLSIGGAGVSLENGQFHVPSPDGGETFVFDRHGRHLRTLDAASGATRYVFHYNPVTGLLDSIDTPDGGLFVERDGNAKPRAIVAPNGQRTELVIDAHGFVEQIDQPDGVVWNLHHGEDGLLDSLSNPTVGTTNQYYYGSLGQQQPSPPDNGLPVQPPLSPPVLSDLVGAIPATFSVSAAGAAKWSTPVVVTPGTAGLEPKLSVNYSSQSGNGLLGLGWSVSGLSTVFRCSKTYARDGDRNAVTLTSADRFCLDGQRLLAVSGVYGADGTVYRTEIDNFSRIISHGVQAGGPAWFEVHTKSGEILEYGNTPDSRVESQGRNVVQRWAVNRLADLNGNYLTYTYHEDHAIGEHRILRIDYTGNTNAATAPFAHVEFNYENRPDASIGYLAGSRISSLKRLKSIASFDGGTLVRELRFDYYIPDFANTASRLARIHSCVNDAGVGKCLPPTEIEWQTADIGFDEPTTLAGPILNTTGMRKAKVIDFDGDGISDLVYGREYGDPTHILLFDSSGEIRQDILTEVPFSRYLLSIDEDGNGATDIVIPSTLALNGAFVPGKRFSYIDGSLQTVSLNAFPVVGEPLVIDYNGDGLHDLIDDGQLWINQQGTGFSPAGTFTLPFIFDTDPDSDEDIALYTRDFRAIELNGDGKQDLLILGRATASYIQMGGGGLIASGVQHGFGSQSASLSIDLNGDGLQDLVFFQDDGIYFHLNQGGKFGPGVFADIRDANGVVLANPVDEIDHIDASYYVRPLDYNNDGFMDLLVPRDGHANWWIYIARRDPVAGVRFVAHDSGIPLGHDAEGQGYKYLRLSDFNGDGLTDMLYPSDDGRLHLRLRKGKRGGLVTRITAGRGRFDEHLDISYQPLTTPGIHEKSHDAHTPEQRDFQGPIYVVSETREDNGIGGQNRKNYRYRGAKLDTRGRGQLGYRQQIVTDHSNGLTETLTFAQRFPYIGMLEKRETRDRFGRLTGGQTQTLAAHWQGSVGASPAFPYIETNITSTYDAPSGKFTHGLRTDSQYDAWGNATQVIVTTIDPGDIRNTKTTVSSYTNDTVNWRLGRLSHSQVTHDAGSYTQGEQHNGGRFGVTSVTRESFFTYDPVTGQLLSETLESGNDALTTTYTLDAFGNRVSATVSGPGITSRTTRTRYDAQGRYPVETENALGHKETYAYNDPLGNRTKLTGPNGLTTRWHYDPLGRETAELRADGTRTDTARGWCGGTLCLDPRGISFQTVATTGQPDAASVQDSRERVILSGVASFDGRLALVRTTYDARGRKASQSRPYFQGGNPLATTTWRYDDLDRLIEEHSPVTGATFIEYDQHSFDWLITRTTNALGQRNSVLRDAQKHILYTQDAEGHITTYQYDAAGNPTRIIDSEGNDIVMHYNVRGEKTAIDDPDMGHWDYRYNALGELIEQTDAKGQTIRIAYDALGRKTRRYQVGNPGASESRWYYDNAPRGNGQLAIGQLARETANGDFERRYRYDSLNRLTATQTTIGSETFTTRQSYDSAGRIDLTTYPSVNGVALRVRNSYNSHGHLDHISDADGPTRYWQALATNADGAYTEEILGQHTERLQSYDTNSGRLHSLLSGPITHNSGSLQHLRYRYDPLGNLLSREDLRQHNKETFGYDALNRLTRIDTDLAGLGYSQTLRYDALGNIQEKDHHSYHYTTGRPHAVSDAHGKAWQYDANGSLIDDGQRQIQWTEYNKPRRIQQNNI